MTDYKPDYPRMAFVYCCDGATDEKLANLFNVTEMTINNWKKEHPDFKEKVQDGKDIYDTGIVEDSLLESCKGKEWIEVVTIKKDGKVLYEKFTKKYLPPNPTTMLFWLKNRNRNRWKDYKAMEIGNLDGKPFNTKPAITDDMTEQQMAAVFEAVKNGE